MLSILDRFEETRPGLIRKSPGERRRETIGLFDEGYWFKRLLEHHDQREENILHLVMSKEERRELLKQCFPK